MSLKQEVDALSELSSESITKKKANKYCPKQLQLPMFLSKTYHMIDKCDSGIATWSETGDNFVVKNVEQFAQSVLPMYFKHNNFSSFARQLNFYGFRKLRSDPILTSDVDPCTACHVRFYHESFQRDKPELLQNIKRATKGSSDQQSKDDMDQLRREVASLKDQLRNTVTDYDRKLAELSYECNRRITSMNQEYDKLLSVVNNALGINNGQGQANVVLSGLNRSNGQGTGQAVLSLGGTPVQMSVNADLLHSLTQAAVTLQDNGRAAGQKRPTPEGDDAEKEPSKSAKV